MALPHDEVGSGPAVILLHAGVADRTMWSEHLEGLADAGYRAVAVDLPGFGEAPVTPGEQAPWTDVLSTMDELSIERAALVGNSFGGAVALRAALVAPDRVSALTLISTPSPALEPSPELEAIWEAEEAALQRGDIEAAIKAVVDAWTLPDASPELRDRVAAMQRRALALQAEAPPATEAPDPAEHPEALARLSVPTLVASGEFDKRDFRQGAEAMARTLPRARHAVIEGAGHLAPLETPEAFRELVLAFLR
ncbi:MAG: Pimeloyl-ACP methyl ester carboxylesterase [Solirubrobacterales bacterium]|nr:Pimeloyl-ACP methyl ester carboxylesterase [Solirubrobacterales bacterium]